MSFGTKRRTYFAAIVVAVAMAGAGAAAGEPAPPAPASRPGGLVYFGLGATAIGALSPGLGASYELAFEPGRGLAQFGILGAAGLHHNGTLLLNASFGGVLQDADDAPYVLGGIGYLARGNIVFDSSNGPEREHVVLTAEAGYIFGRQRRWGQIWGGIRFLIPVVSTHTEGTPLPDLPWGLVTFRFLL